jgi:hypothetical protein
VYKGQDAVADAVGPANPPPALLAAPLLESEEDEYGDPDAAADVADLANPFPTLPAPVVDQARVPADKTMLTDAIFDHEDCEFFEKLRGVPVGDGDGYGDLEYGDFDLALDDFANPPPGRLFF